MNKPTALVFCLIFVAILLRDPESRSNLSADLTHFWSFIQSHIHLWKKFLWILVAGLISYALSKLYAFLFLPVNFARLPKTSEINKKASQVDETPWLSSIKNGDIQDLEDLIISKDRREFGKLQQPYPSGWFKIADSYQLKKGDVQYHQIAGEHLVLFRSENGKAHIADAYCPHLGANLGIGGKVSGNCIQCPFHGWKFDGSTGMCTNVPYLDCAKDTIPSSAKMRLFHCRERNKMIFVYIDKDGNQPSWEIPRNTKIEEGEFVFHGKFEHVVNTHIQDVPENGADTAHFMWLHKISEYDWIRKIADYVWKIEWNPDTLESRSSLPKDKNVYEGLVPGFPNLEHTSTIYMNNKVKIFDGKWTLVEINVTTRQIGPGLVLIDFESIGHYCMVQSVTPLAPLVQKITHTIYGPPGVFHRLASKFFLWGAYSQFIKDVPIWNYKTFRSKPVLVKNDGPVMQYRRWYSRFYPKSENSSASLNSSNSQAS